MIRTLTPQEAGQAVDWAAAEGWNPGLVDLDCFLAQDPGLFLGAFEGGEMLSVISATRYEPGFGFIGFYIARPEARGRGHGIAVWRAAMKQLDGQLVGLEGVVAQQANYRKSGFTLAWKNIRYGGELSALPAPRQPVVPASGVPLAALEALDAAVFPAPRRNFLRAWIGAPGHVALVALRHGEAAGFGVVRKCRTGHKIGPLVAEDAGVAEALVAALAARAGSGTFYLDLPETNPDAVRLAECLAMRPVFETARMYTGPSPPIVMGRLFGVASFELG